jgi:hypothetical protein
MADNTRSYPHAELYNDGSGVIILCDSTIFDAGQLAYFLRFAETHGCTLWLKLAKEEYSRSTIQVRLDLKEMEGEK